MTSIGEGIIWVFAFICVFLLLFSDVFSNGILYSYKTDGNSIFGFVFASWICRTAKKRILFFLSVLHTKLSSFRWYFWIFWPFIYSALSKRCFEAWSSMVTASDMIMIIFVLRSLWNLSKKHQAIKGGSGEILCRHQWKKKHFKIFYRVNSRIQITTLLAYEGRALFQV